MNVITAANESYAYFLLTLATGVWEHFGNRLFVYDLGLKDKGDYVTIPIKEVGIKWRGKKLDIDKVGKITGRGDDIDFEDLMPERFIRPRAIFKPFCIAHFLECYGEPVWWMDADCILRDRIKVEDADVAFTLRPEKELRPDNEYWGLINAGVMYWKKPNELLEAWLAECMKEDLSDQGAMNRVLMREIDFTPDLYDKVVKWRGVKVKFLRTEEYSDHDFGDKSKVWHFKFSTTNLEEKRTKFYNRVEEMVEKHGDLYRIDGKQR